VGIASTVVGAVLDTSPQTPDQQEEDSVAKPVKPERIDPTWPVLPDGEHPVSELAAPTQGSMSPFGDIEFPLDTVPYEHPVTELNK
jgi:hypothetical protein